MTKDKIQKKKGKYKEGSEGVVKKLDQINTVSHHTALTTRPVFVSKPL